MRTTGELLAMAKWIRDPPKRKNVSHSGHSGWDYPLDAPEAGEGRFVVFLRINDRLMESFTLGLRYQEPKMEPAVLIRVNGGHGMHGNPDGTVIEDGPHLHAPTDEELLEFPPVSAWAGGPKMAIALEPKYRNLEFAWQLLSLRCSIAPSETVAKFMSERSAKIDQVTVEDLLG